MSEYLKRFTVITSVVITVVIAAAVVVDTSDHY